MSLSLNGVFYQSVGAIILPFKPVQDANQCIPLGFALNLQYNLYAPTVLLVNADQQLTEVLFETSKVFPEIRRNCPGCNHAAGSDCFCLADW